MSRERRNEERAERQRVNLDALRKERSGDICLEQLLQTTQREL